MKNLFILKKKNPNYFLWNRNLFIVCKSNKLRLYILYTYTAIILYLLA